MAEGRELIERVPIGGTILSMEHITKIYDNGFVANNDVSFDVKKGEILGLVGENGAGKTTLMNVLFGQITPEQGPGDNAQRVRSYIMIPAATAAFSDSAPPRIGRHR